MTLIYKCHFRETIIALQPPSRPVLRMCTADSAQETLTLASLFLASDYSLESQRSGAALLAEDDLPCPHPSALPLSFSVLARFASRHCACSLPESIPSRLYEATRLLRGPQEATLRNSTRTRSLGALDGWPTSQRFASGGSALLFCRPLTNPSPFLRAPPKEGNRLNCSQRFFVARKHHRAALRALLAALWEAFNCVSSPQEAADGGHRQTRKRLEKEIYLHLQRR